VLCSNFVKFSRWEISETVRCLPQKKISHGSPAVAPARIAPKISTANPIQCTQECSKFCHFFLQWHGQFMPPKSHQNTPFQVKWRVFWFCFQHLTYRESERLFCWKAIAEHTDTQYRALPAPLIYAENSAMSRTLSVN